MNRIDGPGAREAKLEYLDGDFKVISPGSFVRCAVSGNAIDLDALKYWSVDRQEAYANVHLSVQREAQLDPAQYKRKN